MIPALCGGRFERNGGALFVPRTFDPANTGSNLILSESNTRVTAKTISVGMTTAVPVLSGDTTVEFQVVGSAGNDVIGIVGAGFDVNMYVGQALWGYGYYDYNGAILHNSAFFIAGTTGYAAGNIIGMKWTHATKTVHFYKDGVSAVSPFVTTDLSAPYYIAVGCGNNGGLDVQLRSNPATFTYTYS